MTATSAVPFFCYNIKTMNAKDIFPRAARKLQGGFARFAPFNVLALTWALCLVRDNHVPWDDFEAHKLPLSLASGACWGMVASLAARLALERRGCSARLLTLVPEICGIAFNEINGCVIGERKQLNKNTACGKTAVILINEHSE